MISRTRLSVALVLSAAINIVGLMFILLCIIRLPSVLALDIGILTICLSIVVNAMTYDLVVRRSQKSVDGPPTEKRSSEVKHATIKRHTV